MTYLLDDIASGYATLIQLHRLQARVAAGMDQDLAQWHLGRAEHLADLAATDYQDDGRDWLRIAILGICAFFFAILVGVAVLRGA